MLFCYVFYSIFVNYVFLYRGPFVFGVAREQSESALIPAYIEIQIAACLYM